MKIKILSNVMKSMLELEINDFIKDKEIHSIQFTFNSGTYAAFIMYYDKEVSNE